MLLSFSDCRTSVVLGYLLLSGCAAPSGLSLFPLSSVTETASTPTPAESGACPTPEKCAAQLRKMVSDPRRDWIGQPQSADAYANGTRLFAYRALRKKLTCNELKRAIEDTHAAASSLQSPRHESARALTGAVAQELKGEQGKRCRPHS